MKRKVEIINTSKLKEAIPELKNSDIEVYLDAENEKSKKQIIQILHEAGRKKVNTILGCILRGAYNNSIYKKESKGVAAIKISGGKSKNQNIRIYCKEFYNNGKKVVMVTPIIKKVQENRKSEKILNIVSTIEKLKY